MLWGHRPVTDIAPADSSPVGLKLQPVPPFLSASCDIVKVGLKSCSCYSRRTYIELCHNSTQQKNRKVVSKLAVGWAFLVFQVCRLSFQSLSLQPQVSVCFKWKACWIKTWGLPQIFVFSRNQQSVYHSGPDGLSSSAMRKLTSGI